MMIFVCYDCNCKWINNNHKGDSMMNHADSIMRNAYNLVKDEVYCNVSVLVEELIKDEKYTEDLLCLFEDEDGLETEVFEFYAVSDWLGDKLLSKGEHVVELLNLNIWGRQTCGQLISMDSVIQDIVFDSNIYPSER